MYNRKSKTRSWPKKNTTKKKEWEWESKSNIYEWNKSVFQVTYVCCIYTNNQQHTQITYKQQQRNLETKKL